MASSNHPLQRQPGRRGEVPTSAGHGPPPPPVWAHAAVPGSLPHRELSKASTSTVEHTVSQQSGNRRSPRARQGGRPTAGGPAHRGGAAPTLSSPPTLRTTTAVGCIPGPGLRLGAAAQTRGSQKKKGVPGLGNGDPERKRGGQGHEKQGNGSSEVEGVRGGGSAEVDGDPGLRDSEMQGVPGGSEVRGGGGSRGSGTEVERVPGGSEVEGVPGLRDSGGGGPGGQGQ